MCFSNLPVEFDADGDPYLADEADDVASPGEDDQVGTIDDDCGCNPDADTAIDAAPEAAYDAILAEMPETTISVLTDGDTAATEVDSSADDRRRDAAEGD
jgi:hypothetical protein